MTARKTIFTLAIISAGLMVSVPSYAGFEWVPAKPAQTTKPVIKNSDLVEMQAPVIEIVKEEPAPEIVAIEMQVETPVELFSDPVAADIEPAPAVAPQPVIIVEEKVMEQSLVVEPKMSYLPDFKMPYYGAETVPFQPQVKSAQPVEEASIRSISLAINPFPVHGAVETAPAAAAPMIKDVQQVPKDFAVVQGFGSELPLAVALGQIVPDDYGYGFGQGVNLAARVSWNGGKSWSEVLADAIAPLGYKAQISNQKVLIKK